MVEVKEEKVDGKLEFALIEGGKHHHTVTRGVLIEQIGLGAKMAVSGNTFTIMLAKYCLDKHIEDGGWVKKYDSFKRMLELQLEKPETLEQVIDGLKQVSDLLDEIIE